jgi:urea transport system permease protein
VANGFAKAQRIGYRIEIVQLRVFVFSAFSPIFAGALYVPQIGVINPSEFSPINSIKNEVKSVEEWP